MSQFEATGSVKPTSNQSLPNPLHLPWYVTRLLDRRALRRKLNVKGLVGVASPRELEGFLVDRAGDARDLFALRGVRTRRSTVFQLMSRSIAADVAAANENRASIGGLATPRDEARLVPASLVAALR
jgi:hypothetical protein